MSALTNAAGLVDRLYELDEQIKAIGREVEKLKTNRQSVEDQLRLLVDGTGASEVAGTFARARFGVKSVPKVVDWQQVYAYVVEHNAFDLLHKRLGVTAWDERVKAGQWVPGVEQVMIPEVKITGLK